MRSALLCVFFALINTQQCRAVEEDDFRPTPIPLNDWRHEKRTGRAGTLHEIIKTEVPPTVAALPAHYWEDALRHSVYLTLVRDKIDQLIAKGIVLSPDANHGHHQFSKEIDDHDLWEKIKRAPFDRLTEHEPSSPGDVQIMSKGRLLEENRGFRFTEDGSSMRQCESDNCAEGVKAFWSVKRVRQRDDETLPGKYHYELTFSVTSQVPKKKRKAHENSIRTFTIRETEPPKDHWNPGSVAHSARPQRAIWFHKNINTATQHHSRHQHNHNLDRIFSSLFTDEDFFGDPPPRHKFIPYPTHIFQSHPKVGFPAPQSEFVHQKKLLPYPYKPHTYQFSHPLPPPPIQHIQQPQTHFLELEFPFNQPHTFSHFDQGYMSSNTVKTTKPAFLPTPVTIPFTKNESVDTKNKFINMTETTFKDTDTGIEPEVTYKVHPIPRPSAVKLNYFGEHVRPPVFNTPPGVFVTMDKKPFKPMPPLKLSHSPKHVKSKPIDFRPSPQVLENKNSDPDPPSPDAEFRPIALGFVEYANKTNTKIVTDKTIRKLRPIDDKEPVTISADDTTSFTPDIITASDNDSSEDTEPMEYTNILGAITRTTPMVSQREITNNAGNFIVMMNTSPMPSTTKLTSTATAATTIATTRRVTPTSTLKPKKRTRPPPKFKGGEKFKKHKRITSTTAKPSVSTMAATLTKSDDLTPQASSTTVGVSKSPKLNSTSSKTISKETVSTTTTIKPTTTKMSTSTTQVTSTSAIPTTTEKEPVITTQPKSKNRFRQSTLMYKGTSVKHDRWSTTGLERNRTVPLSKQFPPRRKGSNFQGYLSTTTKKEETKKDEMLSEQVTTAVESSIKTTTVYPATQPTYEETVDQYEFNSEATSDVEHIKEVQNHSPEIESSTNNEPETKDHSENNITTNTVASENTTELEHQIISSTTEALIPSSSTSVKKKCKKKRPQNNSSTEKVNIHATESSDVIVTSDDSIASMTTTTTEKPITPDIIDELLGAFTFDEPADSSNVVHTTPKSELTVAESQNVESYLHSDQKFEDFLGSFQDKENNNDVNASEEYDDDSRDLSDEEISFYREDDERPERDTNENADYEDRPYSLLELMSME